MAEESVTLKDAVSAAKQRIVDGEAEAGDYTLVRDNDPDWLSRNTSSQKAAYDQDVTYGGQTNTSSSTSSGSSNSTSSSSSSQVSGTRNPLFEYDRNGSVTRESYERALADAERQINGSYSLSSAIGANRNKIKEERARQAREAEARSKVAAWTKSAMLLSDMISAGIGGNVYKRDQDNTEKEAYDERTKLRELQAAEDAQAAMADWKNNKERAAALLEARLKLAGLASQNVSSGTNTATQNSNQSAEQNATQTQGQRDVRTSVRPSGSNSTTTQQRYGGVTINLS